MVKDILAGDSFQLYNFATTCPACGIYSKFSQLVSSAVEETNQRAGSVQRCDHCAAIAVLSVRYEGAKTFVLENIFPYPHASVSSEAPSEVAEALKEAIICRSVGARIAGAVMCRGTVQAIARNQEVQKGQLKNEIDALNVPQELKDVAHSVRIFGNDAAHPDPTTWSPVTDSELDEAIELVKTLIQYIYEMPARVARIKSGTQSSPPVV